MARKRRAKTNGKGSTQAQQADRHALYEQAVQCVEAEIDFVDLTFRTLRGRTARSLREDFCATGHTACEWVRRRKSNVAHAIDIDPEVLDWARTRNTQRLSRAQNRRLQLLNEDVLAVQMPEVDMILAMNFSYWVMKDRPTMSYYFRRAYAGLADDGVLFLDAYGGYEAFREMEEETEYDGFSYVWDQHAYNPINGHGTCKIHFKFPDGSALRDAFVYEWRIWTVPELMEMLTENGFRATVYWEGDTEDGEGNGIFTSATVAQADAGWICYIVAEKNTR